MNMGVRVGVPVAILGFAALALAVGAAVYVIRRRRRAAANAGKENPFDLEGACARVGGLVHCPVRLVWMCLGRDARHKATHVLPAL